MSAIYVGAYAWSWSNFVSSRSSSTCEATSASGVSVLVRDSACSNCSALSTCGLNSFAANSYGGSMSVLYVGAYAWSYSAAPSSNSSGAVGATFASGVSLHVSDSTCLNCGALSTSRLDAFGANSYGGSIGIYIGALSYSLAVGEFRHPSSSVAGATRVHRLSITIKNSTIVDTEALIGECCSTHPIQS